MRFGPNLTSRTKLGPYGLYLGQNVPTRFQLSTTSIFYETRLGTPSNPTHVVWSKFDFKDKIWTVWPPFGTKCPKLDSNCPQPQFFYETRLGTPSNPTHEVWSKFDFKDKIGTVCPPFGTKCPKLDSNCPQPQFFMKQD